MFAFVFFGFFAAFSPAALFFLFLFIPFLAFFARRLLLCARFFTADAFAALARAGLRVFFAFRFPEDFFLGVATTNSFMAQTGLLGLIVGGAYRVASASRPNTEKTSGFRSRLYSAVSRAARLIFSHTSASRARRGGVALALAASARRRSRT